MSRTIALALRGLAMAAVTVTAVVACQDSGPVEPARVPNLDGPSAIKIKPTLYFNGIVFSSDYQSTKNEIYTMNPDGTGLFRETNDSVTDADPDVSPANAKIVWARFSPDGKSSEIFTQNIDGTNRKQLTFLNAVARQPRFSPDGKRIAFVGALPNVGAEIYTMNADGSSMGRITFSMNNSSSPSWSPDGSKIAFKSAGVNGEGSVWTMDASGSNQKEIKTCAAPGCYHMQWSTVANEIAVDHTDGSGIFIIDATTGAQTGVIPGSSYDYTPTWSKDGKTIAFSSWRSGNADRKSVV